MLRPSQIIRAFNMWLKLLGFFWIEGDRYPFLPQKFPWLPCSYCWW